MPEREGRKFFFCLQTMLAVLFLISGVALTIEAAFGGYGIGLLFVAVMADGVLFFVLAALFAATAWHLRP
jgi:cytochrome b subunit of formate dehydrogenase